MKLKTIELKAAAIVNRIPHDIGDVFDVVEHWAKWLIEGKHAVATSKAPTRPSPTPIAGDSGTPTPPAVNINLDAGDPKVEPPGKAPTDQED